MARRHTGGFWFATLHNSENGENGYDVRCGGQALEIAAVRNLVEPRACWTTPGLVRTGAGGPSFVVLLQLCADAGNVSYNVTVTAPETPSNRRRNRRGGEALVACCRHIFHCSPSLQWPPTRACGVTLQDVVAIGKRTRAGVAPTPGKPPIGRGCRKKRPATDEYQICHLVMGFPRVIEPLLTWHRNRSSARCAHTEYMEGWRGTAGAQALRRQPAGQRMGEEYG